MILHMMEVKGRCATVDNAMLVQGTVQEDFVAVTCDGEWDGLDLTLTFEGGGTKVTPARLYDGTWPVPWEVLQKAPTAVFAILEGRADGVLLAHATMADPFVVERSRRSADSEQPYDPTRTDLQAARDEALAAAATARASAIVDADANTLAPDEAATATLEQTEDGQKIVLGIPKGDRGDCDFATFDIEDGELAAYYTTDHNNITFALDGAELEVIYA